MALCTTRESSAGQARGADTLPHVGGPAPWAPGEGHLPSPLPYLTRSFQKQDVKIAVGREKQ